MEHQPDDLIELFYVSDYDDDEGDYREQVQGVTVIPKRDFLIHIDETKYNPCDCNVVGCLSCYLDWNDAWASGYGANCTELWFGIDPSTGKQWDADAAYEEWVSEYEEASA